VTGSMGLRPVDANSGPEAHAPRKVVGAMTGTSMDAVDVALVGIAGRGLSMGVTLLRSHSQPLRALAEPLRGFASQEPLAAGAVAGLAHELAAAHVAAIRGLLGDERADLIAVHGQTVYHAPPLSWQLLDPAPLAYTLQAPVVFDLRAADLAAGGQGAPITPLADYVLFRDAAENRAIVNFGGYCNFTLLPAGRGDLDAIRGGDICACNQLLDGLSRRLFDEPFDMDGRRAHAGHIHPEARAALLALLRKQAAAGRSLGTGDELPEWIARYRDGCSGEDLARSACEALAHVIVETVERIAGQRRIDVYLLAGGGIKNRALYDAFGARCPGRVFSTERCGIPPAYREAAAIAVLGALCQDRVPITLPQITGVRRPAPLAGAWIFP
jgi:anhydro-N-acetylmuramic acid kinase